MIPSRALLASVVLTALLACTDTPTATESVDGLAFGKPAESGVVVRTTSFQFLTMTDTDNHLRATVGFDRQKWCDDGHGQFDAITIEYRTEHDVQTIFHGNGEITDIRVWDGILVVYDYDVGRVSNCDLPLVGTGDANTRFRRVTKKGDSDLFIDNFNGFITAIADDSRKRVNAVITHWDGVRNPADGFQHVINTKITVR